MSSSLRTGAPTAHPGRRHRRVRGARVQGASMDAIAARTHTTCALINYYFGGKEKI
jgi:AcrR family transcriptional regulator